MILAAIITVILFVNLLVYALLRFFIDSGAVPKDHKEEDKSDS